MSFKNKQGEVSWYVIALVLALVVLIVSLFVIPKIRNAQNEATSLTNACAVAGGVCQQSSACSPGTPVPVVSCPDITTDPKNPTKQICCKT